MSTTRSRGKKNPPEKAESAPKTSGKAAPKPVPVDPAVPDPVPFGVLTLMEVFKTALAGVRFPDVDVEVLEEGCEAVRAADAEVRRLFEALEAAQVDLSEARAALHKQGERGLAYARVFAGDDEKINEALDAVELTPKKSGRKAKAKMIPKSEAPPRRAKPKTEAEPPTPDEPAEAEKLSA